MGSCFCPFFPGAVRRGSNGLADDEMGLGLGWVCRWLVRSARRVSGSFILLLDLFRQNQGRNILEEMVNSYRHDRRPHLLSLCRPSPPGPRSTLLASLTCAWSLYPLILPIGSYCDTEGGFSFTVVWLPGSLWQGKNQKIYLLIASRAKIMNYIMSRLCPHICFHGCLCVVTGKI